MNQRLISGSFLFDWKKAIISPIYKKEDKENFKKLLLCLPVLYLW